MGSTARAPGTISSHIMPRTARGWPTTTVSRETVALPELWPELHTRLTPCARPLQLLRVPGRCSYSAQVRKPANILFRSGV